MSGPLGTGSGNPGKDVLAGTGISVSGTTAFTVSNTGVTSLAGSGVSVSAATGAVTVTAPTVTGGTGISVSGSGTTSLTVSATGVQSLTAGTGISVSGTTTPTVTNSGVTSIVAGTNVTVSGATGAVTVNAPGFATPGSSAIGDTAAAGTATTVSRSDHVHGREAAGAPVASAVGDTASAGSATTVARSDHRHSREAFGTPIAVTGGATATSGSATTVARSDHTHSTASLPVLIGNIVLASNTASVTFSSISQNYNHLMILWHGQLVGSTGPVEALNHRYNNVTTNSYITPFGLTSTAFTGWCNQTSGNYVTDWQSCGQIIVYNYSGSNLKKSDFGYYGYNSSATAYSNGTWMSYNQFLVSSPITSITFFNGAGLNIASNATFRLYGLP